MVNGMQKQQVTKTMRATDGAKYKVVLLLGLSILVLPSLFIVKPELDRTHQSLTTKTAHSNSKLSNHQSHDDDRINDSTITSNGEQQSRIVVSLKTMPSRIQYIEKTLSSLLTHQSMAVDKLYLVLPRTKWILTSNHDITNESEAIHYDLPDFLTNLTKNDERLAILRPEYDYGPVDKILYALQEEEQFKSDTTKLIYLDDDVLYHKNVVKTLVEKSEEYPDSVVALSGCTLRSHFRQIAHRFPRQKFDKHPNLYFVLSGSESLTNDETVDVVQGFAGVLVKSSFFDVAEFAELVRNVTRVHDVWKADDFIISGYLEHRKVPKRVVVSDALSTIHKSAATKDNLGTGMHRQTMQAAHELQSRLKIWSQLEFVDYLSLEEYWRDLMDCEAGHKSGCQRAAEARNSVQQDNSTRGEAITRHHATKLLDDYLLPPQST